MNRNVLETIGSPLVQVSSPPGSIVAAKLEAKNPGGSAKDRPALAMVERAEREGVIEPGGHLVEATSGNTGIGLAVVAAVKGYDLTIVMPDSKSIERRQLLKAYGADLDLVSGDMTDARERADHLEETEGMVQLRQFENEANVTAHYRTTAEEILEQTGDRSIDAFVASVGTGGTLTGVGRRLRKVYPEIDIVAVEPAGNPVLSTGEAGSDDFQGMGPGFVSEILDVELIDTVETVSLEAAETECRRLAREEGILVGQSSGAAKIGADWVAGHLADPSLDCPSAPDRSRVLFPDGGAKDCPVVVTVFPDSGERYLSAGTYED